MEIDEQVTVTGDFPNRARAERAMDELLSAGFTRDQLLLSFPDRGMGPSDDESASQTTLTIRTGGRVEDAVRILRDFGAQVSGPGVDTFTGYDTTVTTAETASPTDPIGESGLGAYASRPRTWEEVHPTYRQDWERDRAQAGGRWEEVEPGYRYGHEMAEDARYQGRDWDKVEADLRAGYPGWSRDRGYADDEGVWDRIRDAVRTAWERATGATRDVEEPMAGRQRGFRMRGEEAGMGSDAVDKSDLDHEWHRPGGPHA